MTISIDKLAADVMARLGEIVLPRPSEGGDVPWPEDIITLKVRSLLPEVGARLIREAPSDLLSSPPLRGLGTSFTLMPCGLYAAEIRLPEGFLRLVAVKMSEWGRSVFLPVMPDAREWSGQWSSEPGIAGCPERPRAYLDFDSGGMLLRLVGSTSADDVVSHLAFWTVPSLNAEGFFDFPSPLYPSLVAAIKDSLLTS